MSRSVFAWGNRRLIAYLAFLSAFAPLSTDMYLPALPHMAEALNTTYSLTSLTVSGFLLLFALSMLAWGPLSDKYGRRPVLLAGGVFYVLSSVGIALAGSIGPLLFWRGLQAVSSGAVSSMSLAVVKDILRGAAMEKVVTWIQTVTILAPMLAPVAGGGLLLLTDWRGIFWCLAGCGLLALAGGLALRETRARATQGSVFKALGRIFVVLRTPGFGAPLLLFSAMSMPFMAYLAVSSYVFQTRFGLSAQEYSWFFAFNAGMSLLGPLLHMRFFRHWRRGLVITVHLLLVCVAGGLLLLFGNAGPWHFALLYVPVSFCGSAIRPPSTVLLMQCVRGDNGAVTSLINSGTLLCGSLSMLLCSLPFWSGPVTAAGGISCLVAGAAFLGWLRLARRFS